MMAATKLHNAQYKETYYFKRNQNAYPQNV